jgi:hypothetical protein
MAVKDITLDDNFDLIIENGDFKISDSDMQHIQLICITDLGHWKQFPLLGVGINRYIASSGQTDALKRAINIQLASDGYKVNDILLQATNENFTYSIYAERN